MDYTVIAKTPGDEWVYKVEEMEIWCEENCTGGYNLSSYNMEETEVMFEKEQDAMMFALKWA